MASSTWASDLELLNLPDNRLDSMDRLDHIKCIEESVDKYLPECVYVHHAGDVNVDHRRLHEAVVTACRPTPGHVVKRLLAFEVASSTEWQPPGSAPAFQPNWFVDISNQLERKLQALSVYEGNAGMATFRSIRTSCTLAWCSVGVEAAEAFLVKAAVVKVFLSAAILPFISAVVMLCCRTLARALPPWSICHFLCRRHPGHLITL